MDQPKFTKIDYRGIDLEQQQLFKDYYFYDYKNFDFGRILDKHGDRINTDFNSFVQNNVEYRYLNSNSFRFPFIYDGVGENSQVFQHSLNKWSAAPPDKFVFDEGAHNKSHFNQYASQTQDWQLDPAQKYFKGLYSKEMTNKYETSLNGRDTRLDDGSVLQPYVGNIKFS